VHLQVERTNCSGEKKIKKNKPARTNTDKWKCGNEQEKVASVMRPKYTYGDGGMQLIYNNTFREIKVGKQKD
jgi:hypothetical protein